MPLPHHFEAGDTARAQEVNDNFDHVMSIVGTLTLDDDVLPPGGFRMGPRENAQLSAKHDTTGTVDPAGENRAFVHLGWNAEFYDTGFIDGLGRPLYNYRRYNAGERATATSVGEDGFTVRTTDRTEGDLHSQLVKGFEVNSNGYVYIPQSWQVQGYDGAARDAGDYRLFYTLLPTFPSIFAFNSVGPGASTVNVAAYGVPATAKAVTVHASARVALQPTAETNLRIYRTTNTPFRDSGFAIWWPARGQGTPPRNSSRSGSGIVLLGEGAFAHQFTIERSQPMTGVTVYLTGYFG